MATKVCIIDVELDITIDRLIANDITVLSGGARRELDAAIALSKQVKATKDSQAKQKTDTEQAIIDTMAVAYDKLLAAGNDGIASDELNKMVWPTIANMSAFTIRMKGILSNKGNPYILERTKRLGINYYRFAAFNEPVLEAS